MLNKYCEYPKLPICRPGGYYYVTIYFELPIDRLGGCYVTRCAAKLQLGPSIRLPWLATGSYLGK